MKAIGFVQGQYGDLCMATVAAKSFKKRYINGHLTFGINKKFESILDLFLNNKFIDDIHIWEKYDGWPSESDSKFLEDNRYNLLYHPMPPHTSNYWYLERHQSDEMCARYGLDIIEDNSVYLNDYFSDGREIKDCIVVSLIGNVSGNPKSYSVDDAARFCKFIEKHFGLKTIQIGHHTDPLYASEKFSGTFKESAKLVIESKLLITVDTCWAWIASGYKKKTLGLYSYNYYPNAKTSKNWQAINENAIYLESDLLRNIETENIKNGISKLLRN
jgi:ADP-heptose:LPS heptosyltransferase